MVHLSIFFLSVVLEEEMETIVTVTGKMAQGTE